MSYFLRIELESGLISSAGADWANQVDADIAVDDLGLPLLPARRIKGLWRDGLRDLCDAIRQCGEALPSNDSCCYEVFGEPGAGREGASQVEIEDAYLQGFEPGGNTRRQLKILVVRNTLTREELMDCFARTRAQTALDATTGSAKKNTLRYIRSLQPGGRVFIAPVAIRNKDLVETLALAAAAVQRMGLARTRGLGKISCRLANTETTISKHEPKILLKRVGGILNAAKSGNKPFPSEKKENGSKYDPPAAADSSRSADDHRLMRFRLTLGADALFPTAEGDPNTVASAAHMPGTNILGCFAWAFLNKKRENGSCVSPDAEFQRLFLRGAVSYLNAYPEAMDKPGRRLIPAPHSLRQKKDGERLVDLSNYAGETPPSRRIESKYVDFRESDYNPLKYNSPRMSLHYHHWRAEDRRFGRALGNEIPHGGQLFSYEAIQSGQSFIGALLGSDSDLRQIAELLPSKTICKLGRSSGAQYGGNARLDWIDATPLGYTQSGPEWNSWEKAKKTHAAKTAGATITITCLSPMIAVNENGHPVAEFPKEELAEVLWGKGAKKKIKPCCAWARTAMVGGFLSHLRFPMQQRPALATGSVFKFQLQDGVSGDRLGELERRGLGLMRHAGYGRVAVDLNGEQSLFNFESSMLGEARPTYEEEQLTLESSLIPILAQILARRTSDRLKQGAIDHVDRVNGEEIPSLSALSRVALIVRRKGCSPNAKADLGRFREKAKNQLANCSMLIPLSRNNNLWGGLNDWFEAPEERLKKKIKKTLEENTLLVNLLDESSKDGVLRKSFEEINSLAGSFILACVKGLVNKKRLLSLSKRQERNNHE